MSAADLIAALKARDRQLSDDNSEFVADACFLIERVTRAALKKHADLCRRKTPRIAVRMIDARWQRDEDENPVLDDDGEPVWIEAQLRTCIYFTDWWHGSRPHVVTGWSERLSVVADLLREVDFGSWVELKTVLAMEDLGRLEPPKS